MTWAKDPLFCIVSITLLEPASLRQSPVPVCMGKGVAAWNEVLSLPACRVKEVV